MTLDTAARAGTKSNLADNIEARVECSVKPAAISLHATAGGKSLSVILANHDISNFKSGKDKGCAAISKHARVTQQAISQKAIKFFSSGYKITVALPADENGMEYDLSYDWLVFRNTDGQFVSGPVVPAGGLENVIENKVKSASATEIIINQSSSGEGETSVEKLSFKRHASEWVQDSDVH